jgi:hypothetical protein
MICLYKGDSAICDLLSTHCLVGRRDGRSQIHSRNSCSHLVMIARALSDEGINRYELNLARRRRLHAHRFTSESVLGFLRSKVRCHTRRNQMTTSTTYHSVTQCAADARLFLLLHSFLLFRSIPSLALTSLYTVVAELPSATDA